MTPYNVPATNEQTHFNVVLCSDRTNIWHFEAAIQYLHNGLRCSPKQAADYITACSLLHNIGIVRSEIFINNSCLDLDVSQCINNRIPVLQNYDAYRKRNEIALMFFFVKIDVYVNVI